MTTRLPLALLLVVAACSPRLIPGTEIPETKDTIAIAQVLEAYRSAMERSDAAAILALAAPDYYDTAGTPDPSDDVNRAKLEKSLPADLASVEAVKVDFTLRRIEVHGDQAVAEIFYDSTYRVKTPDGTVVPRRDSDVHRLNLHRIGGTWKIASGL